MIWYVQDNYIELVYIYVVIRQLVSKIEIKHRFKKYDIHVGQLLSSGPLAGHFFTLLWVALAVPTGWPFSASLPSTPRKLVNC